MTIFKFLNVPIPNKPLMVTKGSLNWHFCFYQLLTKDGNPKTGFCQNLTMKKNLLRPGSVGFWTGDISNSVQIIENQCPKVGFNWISWKTVQVTHHYKIMSDLQRYQLESFVWSSINLNSNVFVSLNCLIYSFSANVSVTF